MCPQPGLLDIRTEYAPAWHLGDDPATQGFQVNVGGSHRGSPGKDGYFSLYYIDFLDDGSEGEYLTDRLTRELYQLLKNWRKKMRAPVPTAANPEYDAVFEVREKKQALRQ